MYTEFPCWGQHIVCDATATEFTPSLVSVCEYVWVCVKENAWSCVHLIVPSIVGDLILWLVKSHPYYCGTGHQHSSLENLKGFENEERPAGWASIGSSDPMSSYSRRWGSGRRSARGSNRAVLGRRLVRRHRMETDERFHVRSGHILLLLASDQVLQSKQ